MVGTDGTGDGLPSKPTDNAGAKRNHKAPANRGAPPKRHKTSEVSGKPSGDGSDRPESSRAGVKCPPNEKKGIRNRASPFRLQSVNEGLNPNPKIAIMDTTLGGLLEIASSMPVYLSQWVMKCDNPDKSELVIPDRGRIPVNTESVISMWAMSSAGLRVWWDKPTTEKIWQIHEDFGFEGTTAPYLTAWCKMIKDMNGAADKKFVWAWAVVAFSCFLALTTSVIISPRCYWVISDPELLPRTNIAQFVIDQIRQAFMALGNKKSVCCMVYHLVLLYLGSLEVDEILSYCIPCANAWDSNLIGKVIKRDLIRPGVFGKLQKKLKEKFRDVAQDGLFGGLLKAEQFVSTILPANYDHTKRKLSAMVHGFCTEFEESMSKFVKGFGKLDQGGGSGSKPSRQAPPSAKQRPSKKQCAQQVEDMEEELLPEDETTDDSHEDNSEDVVLDNEDSEDTRGSKEGVEHSDSEDDNEEEETEVDKGDGGDDDDDHDGEDKDNSGEDDGDDQPRDGNGGDGDGGGQGGSSDGNGADDTTGGTGSGGANTERADHSGKSKTDSQKPKYYLRRRT